MNHQVWERYSRERKAWASENLQALASGHLRKRCCSERRKCRQWLTRALARPRKEALTKQEISYCSLTEVGVFEEQEEELASETTCEASIRFILMAEVFSKQLHFLAGD